MAGRNLLISDLDNTLLGDEESLDQFAAWYEGHQGSWRLAYASGRLFDSVDGLIRESALPGPDAVIGGVGTDIHLYPSGELLCAWHEHIDEHWDALRIMEALGSVPGLQLQPWQNQSAFKVSYHLPDAFPDQLRTIRRTLRGISIEAEVIYSSNRDLDLVPSRAGKGAAAAFLASEWRVPPERIIVSGDSGNDRTLFEQGFRGVVVANAHKELKTLNGDDIYHASWPFAGGVLEGIQYWLSRNPSLEQP